MRTGEAARGGSKRRIQRRGVLALTIVTAWVAVATAASAGVIHGFVKETKGAPVSDAVIFAMPTSGSPPPAKQPSRAVMDQQDKEFVPHVLAIQVGTEVVFPNKDNIRHHVYSLSPAKKFELPLYKGTQAPPVKFDRPGVVVLGCNIHDWMLGYIDVLETPYFATTGKDGVAQVANVPAGTYEVHVWHPRLSPGSPTSQSVTLAAGKDALVEFAVSLKPALPPGTARPRR